MAMITKSTTGFEKLLAEWQMYQHKKSISRIIFPCILSAPGVHLEGTVTFITEGEHRLAVRWITVLLSDIRGYSTEGNAITVTIRGEESPLRMEFPDPRIHELAHAEFQNFAREVIPNLTTPPSSS